MPINNKIVGRIKVTATITVDVDVLDDGTGLSDPRLDGLTLRGHREDPNRQRLVDALTQRIRHAVPHLDNEVINTVTGTWISIHELAINRDLTCQFRHCSPLAVDGDGSPRPRPSPGQMHVVHQGPGPYYLENIRTACEHCANIETQPPPQHLTEEQRRRFQRVAWPWHGRILQPTEDPTRKAHNT